MSITDELREYALGWDERNRVRRDLTTIADRIDAEHEAALLNVRTDLMDASGWIRLPKDADGEYIRIGDVMEFANGDGCQPVIREVEAVGVGVFFAWDKANKRYAQHDADAYRHHHAPTVEDVLREFALTVCKDDALTIRKDVVDEYAAKLRLAEGEDA